VVLVNLATTLRSAVINDWSSYKVFVFTPYRMTAAGPESITYGTPEFKAEVAAWMGALAAEHAWVEVTPETAAKEIGRVVDEAARRPVVVFNLCDGIEVDGYPGIKTVRALEASGVPYSGADTAFYEITTPKTVMKNRLLKRGVSTSPFVEIKDPRADGARAGERLGYPLIIKPDVSAASFGISIKSVVHNEAACIEQAGVSLAGERDTENYYEGVFAERFIPGREFTVLCASDPSSHGGVFVYPPVERVFHKALPTHERLLSYDRYWEKYESEGALPDRAPIAHYESAPAEWANALSTLARDAYVALDGVGYGRVDIRRDERTGEFLVLEANCNCGLSTDGETSVSWILRLSGETMPRLLERIFTDAVTRRAGATRRTGRRKTARVEAVGAA
jgi:D-alanine-D-alanine ligase